MFTLHYSNFLISSYKRLDSFVFLFRVFLSSTTLSSKIFRSSSVSLVNYKLQSFNFSIFSLVNSAKPIIQRSQKVCWMASFSTCFSKIILFQNLKKGLCTSVKIDLKSSLVDNVLKTFGFDPSQKVAITQKFLAMSLPNIFVIFAKINFSLGVILFVLD